MEKKGLQAVFFTQMDLQRGTFSFVCIYVGEINICPPWLPLESLQRALVQLMDKADVYQDGEEYHTDYHTHIHTLEDQG